MSKRSFSIAVPQVESPNKQRRRLVAHGTEASQVFGAEGIVATKRWVDADETPKARVLVPTEADQAKVRKMPLLAFTAPYRGGKFYYERECYDEYYQIVTKELDSSAVWGPDGVGEDCVTVSGTPGIGKSVFYAYFFERYRQEHPNTWIIAVAFEQNNVKKLTVAAVGKEPVYYGSDQASRQLLQEASREAEKWKRTEEEGVTDKRLLFLCDGPPDISRRQSVVFTSPNKQWREVSRKFYCDYYMPLWTLDELQEAATLLNYPISDDLIKERFEKFGGVARECLCLNPVISKKAELDLTKQMNAIFDPNMLRKLLLEYETSHYIVHHAPENDRRAFTVPQLASDFVEEKLQERMLTKSYEQREDLRNYIENRQVAASLRGWIFKVDSHEKLRQGNTLHGLTLPVVEHEDQEWVQFCIEESEEIDVFDAERLSPSLAKCGPYHNPKAKNWASIDSFYLPKMETSLMVTKADIMEWCNSTDKRLLLFQMTATETHPVKAAGVLNVLEKLGLLSHLELVALVFVVPKRLLQTFRRQEIVGIPTTGTASVRDINGIGERTAKLLEYYGLATIEKLEAELNDRTDGGELVEEKADVVARINVETSEGLPSEANATTTMKMKDGHPADWARVLRAWREYIQKRQYGNQVATIAQYVCTWEK